MSICELGSRIPCKIITGKSTFLDHYSQFSNVCVLTEPVDKWRDLDGHNLLQLMYEEPERHSYTFQSYVQLTMAQQHTAKTSKAVKIMERSVWSGRFVFAENLKRAQKMADSEFAVYNAWFEFLKTSNDVDLGLDLIIYLRTSPQVAYQRLKARARSEEKIVSLNYLQELHDLHEAWLMNSNSKFCGGARVLVIDADKDLSEVPTVYSEHEQSILEQVKKYHNDSILTLNTCKKPFANLTNK